MRIYLASSWRNKQQPEVLAALRGAGHEVYDFRNPEPGDTGFDWAQADLLPTRPVRAEDMRSALAHPLASKGFNLDFSAMRWADACVLLLPCGRSAHLEAGWMSGAGKPVVILAPVIEEPELMYKCFDFWGSTPLVSTVEELLDTLDRIVPGEIGVCGCRWRSACSP